MGLLRHATTGQQHVLAADQLIGRAPVADLRVDEPLVSAHHARLTWRNDGWELHDLGSTNGTWVGSERLGAGDRVRVRGGDRIAFGDPVNAWVLIDASAAAGAPVASTRGKQRRAPRLSETAITLQVSSDEEHVEVTVFHAGGVVRLPASSLHYVLLTLARQRVSDAAAAHLGDSDRGWVYADDLARQLGVTPTHLNVTIHRLRRHLIEAGIEDGGGIVERRRTTGQLRLGVGTVQVRPR